MMLESVTILSLLHSQLLVERSRLGRSGSASAGLSQLHRYRAEEGNLLVWDYPISC